MVVQSLIHGEFKTRSSVDMPDDFVNLVTNRYVELYEKVTGKAFVPAETKDIVGRIRENLAETEWTVSS